MTARRFVIVGGVAGGAACAARLRRLDEHARIHIFERGPDVSFANCGLPYYLGGVIRNRQQLLVATPERFRDWFNIEVRARHEVAAIDRGNRTVKVRNVQTGGEETVPYDTLVLSPGAAPVRPPVPGVELPGVFVLRNLDDADRLQQWIAQTNARRAVVVGAGYIGLEMAENLTHRGLKVTVLEMGAQIMPVMDPEMVTEVQAALAARDVEVRLGDGLTAIESAGSGLVVVGGKGKKINADLVLLAVGVRPDVGLAKAAGLELGTTGAIRVDDQLRTSDPNIFAVGDAVEVRDVITGLPTVVPLAGLAARQGRLAADAICGRDVHFRGAQGTGVVGVFDWTLALTGATEKKLKQAGMRCEKLYTHSLHHAGYYPGAETISMKLLFSPRDGRVLGAQAVGKAGVDKRIDVVAMAIQKSATVYDLEEAELCYAPQYGSAKDAVNIAGFAAGNVVGGDVEVVHWTEWQAAAAAGNAGPLVVDVRTMPEAASAAIPGTVNIPLGELRGRLAELPRDREIWVHCGVGQRSYYAARILKQHGFQVRTLAGGMKSYKGLPPVQ